MKIIYVLFAVFTANGMIDLERLGTFKTLEDCIAAAKLLERQDYVAVYRGTVEPLMPAHRCRAGFE